MLAGAGRRGMYLRAMRASYICSEALTRSIPVITAQGSCFGNVICKLLACRACWASQDRLACYCDKIAHLSPACQVVQDLHQIITGTVVTYKVVAVKWATKAAVHTGLSILFDSLACAKTANALLCSKCVERVEFCDALWCSETLHKRIKTKA